MAGSVKKIIWLTFLALVFVLSTALLSYAWWVFQIEKGTRALLSGDGQKAAELYREAEAPFVRFPWLAYAVQDDYAKLFFNQIKLLYTGGENHPLLEKLENGGKRFPFLLQRGEYFFWVGNALLRVAAQSQDAETSAQALNIALEEFQRGLVTDPDDWDLKYNYELVRRTLSQKGQSREEEQEKVQSILDKMRPATPPQKQELPPEKRG